MSRKHYRLSNGIVGRVTVVSLGQISEEMSKQMSWWHFERTGKHYRYQPGFHSKRPVTFPDGTKSGIDCRVVKIDSVIAPRFKCSAVHPRTNHILEVIESSASAAANKILDLLDVNTNKRWSGPEFFGFTKPDVARELMKDSEHFLPQHFNKRKKFVEDKLPTPQWNMAAKFPTKDMLFGTNIYGPTMVSSLANDAMMKQLENHSVTASSTHNSPDQSNTENEDVRSGLNGLLLNGNGTLPLMLSSLSNSSTHNSPITTTTSPVSTDSRGEQDTHITWVELQCIGKPYHTQDPSWYSKHHNRWYHIQPGYRALRCARNTVGEEVLIYCEVLAKEARPLFRCSTKSNALREDYNSTKVVHDFLKDMDISVKKRWSGADFFGFTQPSVIQQLFLTEQEEKSLEKKELLSHPLTPTYLPNPNNVSPSTANSNFLEPFSQFMDSQTYRHIYSQNQNAIKNAFSAAKLPTSSTITSTLSMPQLNGQYLQSSIGMLSPDLLSPRFIQNLPNFISNNAVLTSQASNNTTNHSNHSTPNSSRSSFSRYMCVNMTECVRQLKLFINTLYSLQGEDRLNLIQLQKLNTEMERLMLLLKNETSDLNQKISSVSGDQKNIGSPINGFIKLECDGDGRLVDQCVETDPSSGINLELEKLREVEVQCNSCQNSVTFCSGCGGRLALFVPGSSPTSTDTLQTRSPDTVSTSAEATTTNIESSPPTKETATNSPAVDWTPLEVSDKLSEHVCKKIKLSKGM